MKVRDSGMPDEKIWNDFFDIDLILSKLQINNQINDLVEIGSGYGTFTISASTMISGKVYAFDIEAEMIENLEEKIRSFAIDNIIVANRDVLTHTTGLKANSIDYVMLFNILHHDSPSDFFDEVYRILKPGGKIGIIHWRSDIETPRGPGLDIRPKPEQILDWIDKTKFGVFSNPFNLEPYHYGMIIYKL